MEAITWNIVIGVVTGLITASVLLIFKSIFMNSFVPWYRQIMFKGLNLSGSWHSAVNGQKMLLEIKQSCEKLSGKATVHLMKNDFHESERHGLHLDDIRTFDVIGEVSERFVSLRLKHTDTTRIGIVTFLLQIDGDGTRMSGQGCWYAPLTSKIASGERVFYRDEARATKVSQKQTIEENTEVNLNSEFEFESETN
ncbi:hypothetical protein [Methylobacter sp.]|uniref:hypothetical protein n=1 Tax=Methylobacter sp. TaxID=2051955 RepID=UPI00120E9B8E|nr:hypothetical protein [Methylobacter sp.]TAK65099.1 MAG: hypothetical protein EPO18_01030 [Methylobacter sp.]